MSRLITVTTPENIVVTYQAAGIASRFLATVIDLFLQLLLIMFFSSFMNLVGASGLGLGDFASALGIVLVWVTMFGYALIFEALWSGRTPGKKIMGLRVLRDGGYPLNFLSSAVRNLLRIVDFGLIPLGAAPLVLFGVPGLISIFFSPTYKRIGDYLAGTIVVLEENSSPLGKSTLSVLTLQASYFLPYLRNTDRVTLEEYATIRRFVARRRDLEIIVQASLGERLARPLMEKLEIQAPIQVQLQYADFLEALERRYAEENRLF
ncbi:hypothetical protein LBMAG21_10190 [Armatimonadota bacterium]|nr:hypothetical protein LBMAG21_10190 [Armatimonadota bacterium]